MTGRRRAELLGVMTVTDNDTRSGSGPRGSWTPGMLPR